MDKPKLIIMVGGGASGKTWQAEKYAAEHPGTVIVSADLLRKEVYGDELAHWDPATIDDQLKAAGISLEGLDDWAIHRQRTTMGNKIIFKMMNDRVRESLEAGHDVVHDSVNRSVEQRKRIMDNFAGLYGDVEVIYCKCPIELALKRNEKRDRHLPEQGIRDMLDSFEEPSLEEGFSKITVITPDENELADMNQEDK